MRRFYLPCANAHFHVNDSVADEDVLWLARENNVTLHGYSKYIDSQTGQRLWDHAKFTEFHAANDATVSLIRNSKDLHRIMVRALMRDYESGSIYARALCSGMNNCRSGSQKDINETFERNMIALAEAIMYVEEKTGGKFRSRISVSAKRHLDPFRAMQLVEACEHFQNQHPTEANYVTGVDIAGNESARPLAGFYWFAKRAKEIGLRVSMHAGEVRGAADIRAALKMPGVEVISHARNIRKNAALIRHLSKQGIHIANLAPKDIEKALKDAGEEVFRHSGDIQKDLKLLQELRERDIFIERLLISNDMLHGREGENFADNDWTQEDYQAWIALGLGSDDPGMQRRTKGEACPEGTTIADEYWFAKEVLGFTDGQLLEFTVNTIRYSFMAPGDQNKSLQIVRDFARGKHLLPPGAHNPVQRAKAPSVRWFPKAQAKHLDACAA